jgi:hypothetical protein
VGDLEAEAASFAAELTDLFQGVLGARAPRFVAEARLATDVSRVIVRAAGDEPEIKLHVAGYHALSMTLQYECKWDHRKAYLAIHGASIAVAPAGKGAPLFRYEFLHEMQDPGLPCAHLHVHAHRDEVLLALLASDRGRPKRRLAAAYSDGHGKPPQLSSIHFPLGGARMRPSVEDVLQMLITEFEIEVEDGAKDCLDASRATWRRRQIASAVRDSPSEAARALAKLGYTVTPPEDGHIPERWDSLIRL